MLDDVVVFWPDSTGPPNSGQLTDFFNQENEDDTLISPGLIQDYEDSTFKTEKNRAQK